MRHAVTVMVMLLATTSMVPAAAAGPSGGAYAGTHVEFDVAGDAVTNYSVNGERMLASVEMRSGSASGGADASTDLSAMIGLDGAGLSLGATTRTSATVEAEGSGSLTAHDNGHGVLVFDAGDAPGYVEANLSANTSAEETGDGIVTLRNGNGATGSFIVIGDGEVSVNGNGNVSARIGEDGRLVFRSYPEGKDANDERQERLIANGTAVGEVYVMETGGETVVDAVSYGENTSMEATQSAENGVRITVDRAAHDGKVIITSLSDSAAENAGDLRVTVDGEAAARASSYGELRGAIGGEHSKYMVEQSGSANAEASADVLVAVNHFSTRTIGIQSTEGSSGDGTTAAAGGESGTDETTANGVGQPGFGVGAALVALLAAAFVALRRR